ATTLRLGRRLRGAAARTTAPGTAGAFAVAQGAVRAVWCACRYRVALGLEVAAGRRAPGPGRQAGAGCRLWQWLLPVADARRRRSRGDRYRSQLAVLLSVP